MSSPLSDESKILILAERLTNPPYDTLRMGLSTTNITPDHATSLATLTAGELAVTGYARQDVTGWATPILNGTFHAYSEADPVTFDNSSGSPTGTVYTWFFVDYTLNKLVRSGRFSAPFLISAGGSITFIPFEQETGE